MLTRIDMTEKPSAEFRATHVHGGGITWRTLNRAERRARMGRGKTTLSRAMVRAVGGITSSRDRNVLSRIATKRLEATPKQYQHPQARRVAREARQVAR